MKRIGIVGHRYFSSGEVIQYIKEGCHYVLGHFQNQYPHIFALSALAAGADTFFAEGALSLHIPLEIVRPFQNYSLDFSNVEARKRYESIRSAARSEAMLPFDQRSDRAYEAAMNWVLMRSDLLVAVWDGKPSQGRGGTGHAVQQARRQNRPWIHIDSTRHSIQGFNLQSADQILFEGAYAN